MRILETTSLRFLEYGDYFQFKGRKQMYVLTRIYPDGTYEYQSTYSGRKYKARYWEQLNKRVEILQYGS